MGNLSCKPIGYGRGYLTRTRIQSRKAPQMSKLASMTAEEAAKYGPYGKNDRPCTIDCYGKRTEWKSRRAAIFFFTVAAKMCEGAERERYQRIVWELEEGRDGATDGQPVIIGDNVLLPPDPHAMLSELKAERDRMEKNIDYCREHGMPDVAQSFADKWNDLSIKIIKLKRAMREQGLLPPLQ